MKNVTISMDDALAVEARVAAARAGQSLSRFMAEAAREKLSRDHTDIARSRRLEAIERFLSGPPLHISDGGWMPTAEERNRRDR